MADDELAYWEGVFAQHSVKSNPYIQALIDPNLPVQPAFENLIRGYVKHDQTVVRVLDVGCGPLSVLGKRSGNIQFDIVGVDPLTDEYATILSRYGIRRPHTALVGTGEELNNLFRGPDFDFVYSRNALDHCENAHLVIRNMVRLTRTGAKIFINVCQNEAENAAYSGFHRWNFDVLCDQIVVWNPGSIAFLDSLIGGHPYEFKMYEIPDQEKKFPRQIDIIIHKNSIDPSDMTEVAVGIFASYSNKYGWLTLVATGEVEEGFSFFVHGMSGQSIVYGKSFRFYNNNKVRSLTLPKGQCQEVRIGQYYRDQQNNEAPYVNIWNAMLASSD